MTKRLLGDADNDLKPSDPEANSRPSKSPEHSTDSLDEILRYYGGFTTYDASTKGLKKAKQAINQLIYTQVLELIDEIKEYDDVLYRRLRDNAKAKYIGGSDE